MGVNKVVKGNEVMLDLTEDTVTENNLLAGATAHNAAGEAIEGAVLTSVIKSTNISGTTDRNGNVLFIAASANKVPLMAAIPSRYGTPLYSANGNYYIHIWTNSGAVANTAVSGTVFYVEM